MPRWCWETRWLLGWIVVGYLGVLIAGVLLDDVVCVADPPESTWDWTLCSIGFLVNVVAWISWVGGGVLLGYIWFTRPREQPTWTSFREFLRHWPLYVVSLLIAGMVVGLIAGLQYLIGNLIAEFTGA